MKKEVSVYREYLQFLREHKKLWLLPMLFVFAIVAFLLFIAKSGGVIAPFVYTLF